MESKIKYLSLFSGIGGFELGIQQAYEDIYIEKEKERVGEKDEKTLREQEGEINYEGDKRLGGCRAGLQQHSDRSSAGQPDCIGYSEIDKYACQIYEKHFNHKNYGDITKINAETYQTLISWWVDSHTNLSLSQENEADSMIQEARSSLKSLGLLGKNNHAFYSLKTSRGYYLTTKDEHFIPSSPRLMNWGTTVNGKCLTARITESHKTGSECSLSDILEEQVDQKYFLSEKAQIKILSSLTVQNTQIIGSTEKKV